MAPGLPLAIANRGFHQLSVKTHPGQCERSRCLPIDSLLCFAVACGAVRFAALNLTILARHPGGDFVKALLFEAVVAAEDKPLKPER
jgi:hypothetical protein